MLMAANLALEIFTLLGYLFSSSSARTFSPAVVIVAAISGTIVRKLRKGLAAPIDGDKGNPAMFDLIPFTGAGRKVANRDGNT